MENLPFHDWLPLVFAGLMGLSILIYVVLDGFDLGVGILSIGATADERDVMVGSIGPFWDANETWLVMAMGLLLVAFPAAHGDILTALYLPTTFMLIGLILRGVAFEFRAKAPVERKGAWDRAFFAGSLIAAFSQGYMLGVYVIGLDQSASGIAFGILTGLCLAASYAFIGAAWLLAKTEDMLQIRAAGWCRALIVPTAMGMIAVSVATPLASPAMFEKWFRLPEMVLLAPIPLVAGALFGLLLWLLREMPMRDDRLSWAPFAITCGIFVLGFLGLAYSFFPYVVPGELTIWEAASSRDALMIILWGALVTMPVIGGYTIFAYRVFGGKATALRYE